MTDSVTDERDFDIKYRPKTLAEVIGQDAAVKTIKSFGTKIPRVLLLHGPSGSGKTTCGRIITQEVLKVPLKGMDLHEINCGVVDSAIEMVRELRAQQGSAPLSGTKRVWILDEVQVLSRTKYAQEALLKVLEECPEWVQFILCTTDPKRLLPAIRNRCVDVAFVMLHARCLNELIDRVTTSEGFALTADVRERVVALSEGAARNCVKLLQKIAHLPTEAEQLDALGSGFNEGTEEFALVKALCFYGQGRPSWPAVAKILRDLAESSPEGLRCMILASARSALLSETKSANHAHARKVIECLSDPMDDQRSGAALLAARLWEVCNSK